MATPTQVIKDFLFDLITYLPAKYYQYKDSDRLSQMEFRYGLYSTLLTLELYYFAPWYTFIVIPLTIETITEVSNKIFRREVIPSLDQLDHMWEVVLAFFIGPFLALTMILSYIDTKKLKVILEVERKIEECIDGQRN